MMGWLRRGGAALRRTNDGELIRLFTPEGE